MKVTVKKELFSSILGRLSKFAGDGKVLPIYANFLIKVSAENRMQIICGDGNTYVFDTYNLIKVEEPGETTVGAKELTRLIDSLGGTNDELLLNLVDNKLVVKQGRSEFKLQTMPAELYPDLKLDERKSADDVLINLKDLQTAFKCARVCVAKDMTNPYLTGYKINDVMFTSDALKICIYSGKFGELGLLLSQTCVDAILYASKDEDEMRLARKGNEVYLYTDGYAILSTMVDGIDKFPPSSAFFETEMEVTINLRREVIVPVIKRACIFTLADLSNAVRLTFKPGEIVVSSFADVDAGGSMEIIEYPYTGPEISVLIDGEDMASILNGLLADGFQLTFEQDCPYVKVTQGDLMYVLCTLDFNKE